MRLKNSGLPEFFVFGAGREALAAVEQGNRDEKT
jgi:hypothetical protein